MSKDDIALGLDMILNGRKQIDDETQVVAGRKSGRPRKGDDSFASVAKRKTSLQIEDRQYEMIKQISVDKGININELVNYALRLFIEKYEGGNGPVVIRQSSGSIDSLGF